MRYRKLLFAAGVLVVAFLGMLITKAPGVAELLDGPDFCGSCHVMDVQVESYLRSSHRETATCGDCHIPHSLVPGAAYKAFTGTRDIIYVTLNIQPEVVRMTGLGETVVHNNCVRCHEALLREIGDTRRDGGRQCFDCHRTNFHFTY